MRLTAEAALRGVVRTLHERIAPVVEPGYATETLRLAELLLTITANGMDDAAALRVAENSAIRALCGEAAKIDLGHPELTARLVAAASSVDPGLRISVLDTETARLRLLLVELHEAAELHDTAEACALTQAIWRLLRNLDMARAPR